MPSPLSVSTPMGDFLDSATQAEMRAALGVASPMARGSGTLMANTSPATSPSDLVVEFVSYATDSVLTLTFNSTAYDFAFASSDPGGGVIWIDNTSFTTLGEISDALAIAISGQSITNITPSSDGIGTVTIANGSTGVSSNSSGSFSVLIGNITGGGSGSNASGGVSEVELIAAVTGKKIKTVMAFLCGSFNGTVALFLKKSGVYSQISGDIAFNPSAGQHFLPINLTTQTYWMNGKDNGESLVCKVTGPMPDDATDGFVSAITEQY